MPARKKAGQKATKTKRSGSASGSKTAVRPSKKTAARPSKKTAVRPSKKAAGGSRKRGGPDHESLYTFHVCLLSGPVARRLTGQEVIRVIELGDRHSLHDLHGAIFDAFGREDEHLYEFQLGLDFGDPANERYDAPSPAGWESDAGNAVTTRLGDVPLREGSVLYYWFDFGDDWIHGIQVTDVRPADGASPRGLIKSKSVGRSPPQ